MGSPGPAAGSDQDALTSQAPPWMAGPRKTGSAWAALNDTLHAPARAELRLSLNGQQYFDAASGDASQSELLYIAHPTLHQAMPSGATVGTEAAVTVLGFKFDPAGVRDGCPADVCAPSCPCVRFAGTEVPATIAAEGRLTVTLVLEESPPPYAVEYAYPHSGHHRVTCALFMMLFFLSLFLVVRRVVTLCCATPKPRFAAVVPPQQRVQLSVEPLVAAKITTTKM